MPRRIELPPTAAPVSAPSPSRARALGAASPTLAALMAICGAATPLLAQAPADTAGRPPAGPTPAARAARPWPEAGTRVRLTLADPTARLGGELYVGGRPTLEGRVVVMDAGTAVVRLQSGARFTFPSTAVAHLEAREGEGWCARRLLARAACTAAGALTGAAVMGASVAVAAGPESRAAYVRDAARLGAIVGGILSVATGHDLWRPVSGWSRP